jgi:hypothetical protein
VRIGTVEDLGRDFRITEIYAQMQATKFSCLVIAIALAVCAKDKPRITIGPSEAPLSPPTCKESSYGYLHMGERTKIAPVEVGDYVQGELDDGKIVTVYPESKSGVFVYSKCPTTDSQ